MTCDRISLEQKNKVINNREQPGIVLTIRDRTCRRERWAVNRKEIKETTDDMPTQYPRQTANAVPIRVPSS